MKSTPNIMHQPCLYETHSEDHCFKPPGLGAKVETRKEKANKPGI